MTASDKSKPTLDPFRWVDLYSDYLYKYAFVRVRNVAIAEDLVQETFLSALRHKEQYKGAASEKT